MIRKSFVGVAGAVVIAAVCGQAFTRAQGNAQGAAGSQAPAKANTTQSAPAKSDSSNPIPATTPTQQPTTGNAEEAKPAAGPVMSVRIPRQVMADGKPLPAGTYTLRVTDQSPSPVVGQTPAESRWVEFVQGGQVKGREVGTIKSAAEAKRIAKQGLPGANSASVQTLYGNDYLRVWINKGGTNFLVHLPSAASTSGD